MAGRLCILAQVKLTQYETLLKSFIDLIDPDDFLKDDLVNQGRPYRIDPHITVLFGMPKLPSQQCIKTIKEHPTTIGLKGMDAFRTRDKLFREGSRHSYDILHVVLDTPKVDGWRTVMMLDTGTMPDRRGFHPHMTVAYLKAGAADKYIEMFKPKIVDHTPERVTELLFKEFQKPPILMRIGFDMEVNETKTEQLKRVSEKDLDEREHKVLDTLRNLYDSIGLSDGALLLLQDHVNNMVKTRVISNSAGHAKGNLNASLCEAICGILEMAEDRISSAKRPKN